MKCPNISEQKFVRKNDNILLSVVCAETLIELMIMGSRIWKTDDSVSTRDFSFLSDISLPVLTGELHSTHTVVVFLDKPARLRFVKLNQN